jgi:hypothetical protein
VLIPLTQIPQLPEQDSTLLRREVPPFGARLESRAGGRDGGVDVFLAGGFDGCDEGFVVGVDGFDLLAGTLVSFFGWEYRLVESIWCRLGL